MGKALIISVNMGYGHQRTADNLKDLGEIINANDYQGIPRRDREIWESTRKFYEFISNFERTPLIGNIAFLIFDFFQKILSFYPKRIYSRPSFTLNQIYFLFKKGWGENLIENCKLQNEKLPLICTFFTPAFMAEFFGYQGEIFCVVCDADIARPWAPLNPRKSKIKYFAPNQRVVERLKLYGVREESIFLTGYPLPKELIGSEKMEILKENLRYRILNLDPKKRYFEKYKDLIEKKLGKLPGKSDHPLTILFSIGGAGAQKEIGVKIIKTLKEKIKKGQIKIVISTGIKKRVRDYFLKNLKSLEMEKFLGEKVEIIFEEKIEDYFRKFNQTLKKTDVLWTKPSELSFYSALGIPIIISPPIGSQEEFNKRYLLKSGFGMTQESPNYADQWFFDWLEQGYLAEAAMEGFVEGEKLGTFNIEKIISR